MTLSVYVGLKNVVNFGHFRYDVCVWKTLEIETVPVSPFEIEKRGVAFRNPKKGVSEVKDVPCCQVRLSYEVCINLYKTFQRYRYLGRVQHWGSCRLGVFMSRLHHVVDRLPTRSWSRASTCQSSSAHLTLRTLGQGRCRMVTRSHLERSRTRQTSSAGGLPTWVDNLL